MSEYYIRQKDTETARGPFTLDKLQSLAESGHLDADTLYYDESQSAWLPLSENKDILQAITPQKETLKLKTKSKVDILNTPQEEKPISVHEMLAAAEGDTDETKHLKVAAVSRERAAASGPVIIGVMMVVSAISLVFPNLDLVEKVLNEGQYALLLQRPTVIAGLFDCLMAIFLFLGVTEVFPLVRARAMLGLGYFAYIGWATGQPAMALAAAVGSLGIFACTLMPRFLPMAACGGLGIAGMIGFAVVTLVP